MKFVKKDGIVNADRWFKNGDHPLDYIKQVEEIDFDFQPCQCISQKYEYKIKTYSVKFQKENDWEGQLVRRFRHPHVSGSDKCQQCKKIFNNHGWIDCGKNGVVVVCPGDMVVQYYDGTYHSMSYRYFKENYIQLGVNDEFK